MPKKSSSKEKSTQMAEGPVVEDDKKKPCITPKKVGDEIDEIFAGKKRKKPDNSEKKAKKDVGNVEASKLDNKADKTENKKKRKTKDIKKSSGDGDKENSNHILDKPSQKRKRTGDGLTIYTEEELGIGKSDAGGTSLCPFDCDCCF